MATVLHIVGLVVALTAAVVGTYLSNRDEKGAPTRGGKVLIGLASVGTLINGAVFFLTQPSHQVRRLESGPVASFYLHWSLPVASDLGSDLAVLEDRRLADLEDCQGGECWWGLDRVEALHTTAIWSTIARDLVGHENGRYIVLIAADQTANAILYSREPDDPMLMDPLNMIAGFSGGKIEFSWSIEPKDLPKVLDKQNDEIPFSADLPDNLLVAVLFDAGDAPFSGDNWAHPSTMNNLWMVGADLADDVRLDLPGSSSLRIRLNNVPDAEFNYRLEDMHVGHLVDLEQLGEYRSERLLLQYSLQESPFH